MSDKIPTSSVIVVAAIAVAASIFMWTAVHALFYAPEIEVIVPPSTFKKTTFAAPDEYPDRISIPSLQINTAIQEVGLNGRGNMAVPSNYRDVGWYKYGPVPGARGSAVIDGHVDNGLGLDGVFKHLGELHPGDDVFIDTKNGARPHFVVEAVELYPYKEAPTDRIFNRTDTARLNLVTCDGTWLKGDKTYDHRLVVYTKLQS